MDIRCPQCQTLYEFDESKLDSGSATLKCRNCEHMFRLGEDAQPSREDERRWMVREPAGDEILYFNGFDKLHQWIVEQEVDQTWELSRTGDKWTRLGDIGEFGPIFEAVGNVSSVESESTVSRSEQSGTSEQRESRNTLNQFNAQDGTPDPGDTAPSPPSGGPNRGAGSGPPSGEAGSGSSGVSVPDNSVSGSDIEQPSREERTKHRTQSPAPSGTTRAERDPRKSGDSGRSSSTSGGPGARSERRQQSSGGGRAESAESGPSDVQLDSGQFGTGGQETRSRQESGDAWEMGEEQVGFDETTAVSDEWEPQESGGLGGKTVAVVALLLAVGGAAYLWTFQREMVRGWIGSSAGDREVAGADSAGVQSAANAGRVGLYQALGVAKGASETEGRELIVAARDRATSNVTEAFEMGSEEAEGAADSRGEGAAAAGGGGGGGGGGGVLSILKRANEELQGGSSARAKELFQRVLERDSNNSEALTGLGWAELSSGNPAGARRQFEKALEINPSFGDAYIGLGHAFRELGDGKNALDAYNTYLEKFPNGSKASIAEYQRDELRDKLGVN